MRHPMYLTSLFLMVFTAPALVAQVPSAWSGVLNRLTRFAQSPGSPVRVIKRDLLSPMNGLFRSTAMMIHPLRLLMMLLLISLPGQAQRAQQLIIILEPAGAYIDAPIAPASTSAGVALHFAGSTDFGTTFSWTFGDGTVASGLTADHAYAAAGTFSATFTASASGYKTSFTTITVTVNAATAPTITSQPVSQTVTVGATASFSVTATGTAPLSYQWRKNGTAISGATSASYTTPATVIGDNGALFSVVATNSAGSATSSNATLTVNASADIMITLSPASVSMLVGGSQALTATVSGTTNTVVTWTCSGGAISGTGSSITWTAPQVAGTYIVTARSQADTAQTATATIRVNPVICAL